MQVKNKIGSGIDISKNYNKDHKKPSLGTVLPKGKTGEFGVDSNSEAK